MADSHYAPAGSVGAKAAQIYRTTYAIGDIHGRLDLFERMIEKIRGDAADSPDLPLVVLLGDYVDRGPASKGVIERAIRLQGEDWCEVVGLIGNHEMAMLKFLHLPEAGPAWLEHGGMATLASYGVGMPAMGDADRFTTLRDALQEAMPREHLKFLLDLRLYQVLDDYLFVHAGVRPGLPISEQSADDMLWIRSAFLNADRASDKVVVHGHTPEEAPVSRRWRIGLDTGAYATGVLSAVRLRAGERYIFQVR